MQPSELSELSRPPERAQTERSIRRLLAQRTRDDIESMLSMAHPDIVYTVHGARAVYPFAGRYEGIDEIRRILAIAITEFDNLGSVIHKILIDGPTVAVERTATLRHRGTSAVDQIDIVDFLRSKDGLLVEVSEHADTLAVVRLSGTIP